MSDEHKYAPVKIVGLMCGVGPDRIREDVRQGRLRHDGRIGEATGYNRRRGYQVHMGDALSLYGSSLLDEWTPRKPTPWGTEYTVAHGGKTTAISSTTPAEAAGAYAARLSLALPARVSVDGVEYVVADAGEELMAIEAHHVDEAIAARDAGRSPRGMSSARRNLVRRILIGMGYTSRGSDARHSKACGRAIRAAAARLGISISEAGRRIGRPNNIFGWSQGKTTPYPAARKAIRDALGVDIDEICRGGDKYEWT